jgi:tRNA (mo5U34)-methyltransferase
MAENNLNALDIEQKIIELGPFYHNIHLPFGIKTAPEQLTPARGNNYSLLCNSLPDDLTGKTVLDIGCNAGAFSIEAKKRGASKVVGIDCNAKFIDQARFCAHVLGLDIEYQVGEVSRFLSDSPPFDLVIFVGVLYHLSDPIAIAKLVRKVTKEICLLETVGVSPKFREYEEGLIQLPRPKICHSGSTWINKEGIRHIFVDVAKFSEFKLLLDGGRIAALLTV